MDVNSSGSATVQRQGDQDNESGSMIITKQKIANTCASGSQHGSDLNDNLIPPTEPVCVSNETSPPESTSGPCVLSDDEEEIKLKNEFEDSTITKSDNLIFDMTELEYIASLVQDSLSPISVTENNDSEYEFVDDSTSDSDSDTSTEESDSSSDTSDSEPDLEMRNKMEEDEDAQVSKVPPKTKDEVLPSELPPEPALDIHLPETAVLKPVGEVISFVEKMIVVKAFQNVPALNDETVLFGEGRKPVGKVFEVFGPVESPFYTFRFTKSVIDDDSPAPAVGSVIYYAPDSKDVTNYVFVAQIKRMKGSDASWQHDQEPPDEAIEFSDDEEEGIAKKVKKKKRKPDRPKESDNTEIDAETMLRGGSGYKRTGRGQQNKRFQTRKDSQNGGNIEKSHYMRGGRRDMGRAANRGWDRRAAHRGGNHGTRGGSGRGRDPYIDCVGGRIPFQNDSHNGVGQMPQQHFSTRNQYKPNQRPPFCNENQHGNQRFPNPNQHGNQRFPNPNQYREQRFPTPANEHFSFAKNMEWPEQSHGPRQPLHLDDHFQTRPPNPNMNGQMPQHHFSPRNQYEPNQRPPFSNANQHDRQRFPDPNQYGDQRFLTPENEHVSFARNVEWQGQSHGPSHGPRQPLPLDDQFQTRPPNPNMNGHLNDGNRQPHPQPPNVFQCERPPFFAGP